MLDELTKLFALWVALSSAFFMLIIGVIFLITPPTIEGGTWAIDTIIRLTVQEYAGPSAIISALIGAYLTTLVMRRRWIRAR